MAAITAAQLVAILKRYYNSAKFNEDIFGSPDRWLMNTLSDRMTGGEHDPSVVYRENSQGIAADFLTAQTNSNNPKFSQFQVTPPAEGLHAVLQITTDMIMRSRDRNMAFVEDQVWRFKDLINGLSNFVEQCLLGDGTGVIGRTVPVTGTTITLDDPDDAKRFHEGMRVVFGETPTGALRDSGQSILVTGVDYESGTVNLEEDLSVISGITTLDYIFREGTAQNGGSAPVVPYGLDAWLPASTPSATAFYGVDRSLSPTKLSGVRSTGSLSDIYASVNDHVARCKSFGSSIRNLVGLTSHINVGRLSKQTQTQVLQTPGKTAQVGFSSVTINTPAGETKIFGSPWVKDNTLFTLDLSVMEIIRLGDKLVYVWDLDGSMTQRLPSASGVEIRAESRPAIKINKPGNCGRITLS